MTEPRRLVGGEATEFEQWLLSAAARERPSPEQRRRMWQAVLLGQLGLATTSFSAAAGTLGQMVAIALVAGTLAGQGSSPVVPRAHAGVVVTTTATALSLPPPTAPRAPGVAAAVLEPAAEVKSEPRPSLLGEPRTGGSPRPNPELRTSGDLGEEIRLLDRARASMGAAAPDRALSTLDEYRKRFPRGSFQQEATVLRIEALALAGQRPAAAAGARRFIATHPSSPHLDRLRTIAGSAPPPP
jgi:hypothetical protein